MKIYHVTYWDPCNGMGGHSQSKGYFATRVLAERYIRPRATGWDTNAYTISEIDVQDDDGGGTVLDALKEYLTAE